MNAEKTYEPFVEGELLIMTDGDYSDYSVRAVVRVAKAFDVYEKEAEFKKLNEDKGRYETGPGWFVAWLSAGGFIEDVTYIEVDLGSQFDLCVS